MKIDQSPVSRLLQGQQPQNDGRSTGVQQKPGAAPVADATSSATSTQLGQALQDDTQDIDAARVDEIRAAIADGTLQINPEKIAAGLIASLQRELQQEP